MKHILTGLMILATGMVAMAQNETDAIRFSLNRPTGTARSISLGGAMGALGGDYTSIGINPAGIAVYRSSEFTFTPSLTYTQTKASYNGTASEDDKFYLPIQQIGFVGTYKPSLEPATGLISTHFSIGYTRNNSFARNTYIQGRGLQSSLLDEFVSYSNTFLPGELSNFYEGIAYDVELLELLPGAADVYYSAFEYLNEAEGKIVFGPLYGINQGKVITERGSSGEFSIAGGANFSHKFYIGGSLGVSTLYYSMKSEHYETATMGANGRYAAEYYASREGMGLKTLDYFSFNDNFTTTGVGVNLKVGVIFKPVNSVRIGAAVHTPNFYSIDLEYETDVKAKYLNGTTILPEKVPFGEFSYNFRTPWKLMGSLAYIIGDKGLVSVDYERTNYANMKYKSKGGSFQEMNNMDAMNDKISDTFRATNNLRFGAEYRVSETISLRGGYAAYQNPYKKGFLNSKGTHNAFSGGLGYRMSNMYIDFAYLLRQEKDIHSLYNSPDIGQEYQPVANITTNTHQFAVTLGWRF